MSERKSERMRGFRCDGKFQGNFTDQQIEAK
jgi:hypothetical protein